MGNGKISGYEFYYPAISRATILKKHGDMPYLNDPSLLLGDDGSRLNCCGLFKEMTMH